MTDALILVNGLAASGKTTLSRALAPELDAAALTKDALKEPLWELLEGRADHRRLGALAMETLWRLAAETDAPVLVDAVFDSRRGDLEFVLAGIELAGATRVVEVFCDVAPALARERYIARTPSRSPAHPAWVGPATTLEPLGAWPLIRVDTTRAVDIPALADRIRDALG